MFVLVDNKANQSDELTQFLRHLVDKFKVGTSSNRIALAQFGEDVSLEIRFDAYQTKAEALTLIEQFKLRTTGQRKLGKAIDFVRHYLVQIGASRRGSQSYKQHLILVGTGESDDKTFRAIRDLKKEKVTIVNVDLSKKITGVDFEFRERLFSAPPRGKPGDTDELLSSRVIEDHVMHTSSRNSVQLVQDVETAVMSKDFIDVIGGKSIVLLRKYYRNGNVLTCNKICL